MKSLPPYPTPRIGQRITDSTLGECIIVRVHRPGTIDVEQVRTGRWFRITGLAFV